MQLRDYQEYAVNSFFNYFLEGKTGNPLIAMPTGTGKSVVIAMIIQRLLKECPYLTILNLTHVKELIEQNYARLKGCWSNAPAGIYSASVGQKDTTLPIIFGGIQSVIKSPEQFGKVDIILIDECHLVSPNADTSYSKLIAFYKKRNPNLVVAGLTATPYRMGSGLLVEGPTFTDYACNMCEMESFNWFIEEGYLAPLVSPNTEFKIDVDGVGKRGGEFIEKELQRVTDKDEVTQSCVEEMIWRGEGRNKWLIFTTGVDHAEHVAQCLNYMGVSALAVHGKLSGKEREKRLAAHRTGAVKALVNMGVLTTGYDDSEIDLLGIMRATNSPGLWVQIAGRGTRPLYADGFDLTTKQGRLDAIAYSDKQDCLVLDFAGNITRVGPVNDPVVPDKKKKGGGDAPVRLCPSCNNYIHASLRYCNVKDPKTGVVCGHEFPPETKFSHNASQASILAKPDEIIVEDFTIKNVFYKLVTPNNKPSSIIVHYHCEKGRKFMDYLCFEHGGYPTVASQRLWRQKTGSEDYPQTTLEALKRTDELKPPSVLKVWLKKGKPKILNYDYGEGFIK